MSQNDDIIRFLLDGELKQLRFSRDEDLRPDTSLLNYLRSIGHTGVKEGCGEGDCGACTVVIARLKGSRLQYQAINSCLLFLPMIHGCQVITVHNLKTVAKADTIYHPVQQALVEHHGSQCGYCTPGIVMSMFALWKNHTHFNQEMIKEGLSGNLCRCTGYQPIVDAMMSLSGTTRDDHFSGSEGNTVKILRELGEQQVPISINTGEVTYFKPVSLENALVLKKTHPEALLVSGATDLAVAVNKGKKEIKSCLDISGIEELKHIRKEKSSIVFGPCTSIEDLGKDAEKELPALHEMITLFGSPQIRNMASPGGNIASASPIGDLLPVLMAYDCELEIRNKDAQRKILLEDFILGYHQTDLDNTEMITSIRVPLPGKDVVIKSYKISKRKDVDISTVSSAFRICTDREGMITEVRLYYGGMAAKTVRAEKAEAFLLGKPWTKDTVIRASGMIGSEFTPISDARSSAEGRTIMSENLLVKFWEDTKDISS